VREKKVPAKKKVAKKPKEKPVKGLSALEKKKNPQGRPSKYKPEFDRLAYKLCLLGHTDAELAKFFDVNEDTIHEWKKVHNSFSESILEGKELVDMDVAESLYKGTQDRMVTEQIAIKVKRGKDNEEVKVVDVQKFVPGDFRNQQFWLKNRRSDKWRDKHEIAQTVTQRTTIIDWSDDGTNDTQANA